MVGGPSLGSSSLTEGALKVLSGDGVHGLVALDVVLHRDPRVGVPEEFGGEECALGVVDDGRDGAAEAVWGDVLDPGCVHHVAQEPADVVRRVGRTHTRAVQERGRFCVAATQQARADRLQRERRQRDAANRAIRLRMILPVRRLALATDNRPGNPRCRDRAVHVEILEADGEDFADTRRGAEHDFDDLPELPIRPRSRQYPPGLPSLDRSADVLHFADGKRLGDGPLPMQPRDVIHRVARKDLVTDREREGEAENDASVLGPTVAALSESFEEVVAAGDPDLPEGEVFECREDEGAHVTLVEIPRRSGEAVFYLQVFQPVRDELRERAVGAHPVESGLVEGAFDELLLQLALRGSA